MKWYRPFISFLPLIYAAGATLLLFLVLLAGVRDAIPLNQVFFLRAATTGNGVQSSNGDAHFTLWNVCGATMNGQNTNCGPITAAFGFKPQEQVGATAVMGDQFLLSKVFFSFMIIATFFCALTMLTSIVGCLGRIGAAIANLMAMLAFATTAVAASLMTVVYVRGRDSFRAAGIESSIGVKAFAYVWTAVALMLLCVLLFTLGCLSPGDRKKSKRAPSYVQEKPLVTDNESLNHRSMTPIPVATIPVTEARSSYERMPADPYHQPVGTQHGSHAMIADNLPRSSYERQGRELPHNYNHAAGNNLPVAPPLDGTVERNANYIR